MPKKTQKQTKNMRKYKAAKEEHTNRVKEGRSCKVAEEAYEKNDPVPKQT